MEATHRFLTVLSNGSVFQPLSSVEKRADAAVRTLRFVFPPLGFAALRRSPRAVHR